MDEILAGLHDAPVFDPPSALAQSFEMENGFITDHPDQSLYSTDIGAQLCAAQPPQGSADMDYLNIEDQDVSKLLSGVTDADNSAVANAKSNAANPSNPASSVIDFGLITSNSKQIDAELSPSPSARLAPSIPPTSPADAARLRLRPIALLLVADAWKLSSTPAAFIRAVRERLATSQNIADDSAVPASTDPAEAPPLQPVPWQLASAAEGAILDALLIKIVNSEAASTRLLRYLRYALVTGIVSQRAAVAACLRWINGTANISDRVLHALARLLADLIPHYRFHIMEGVDVRPEVKDFLSAFTIVVRSAARAPTSLARVLANVISHDRVVALVRASARRVPAARAPLDAALAELETAPPAPHPHAPQPCSAIVVAPQLTDLIPRLKRGLCVGATTIESITASIENMRAPSSDPSFNAILPTAYAITHQIFGMEVPKALQNLWKSKEDQMSDFRLLRSLEQTIKTPQQAVQQDQPDHGQQSRYGFKIKLQACEAIVRFFAERSVAPDVTEQWKKNWGGKERLKRIIRDTIPQIKSEIRSETSALVIAMFITCCACLCLGSALRIDDANDGVNVLDSVEASMQESQNEEVEETMGELIGFAVGSLEEAAKAEEIPSWRSFGLWLLFLMSRAGSILRASGCEHARAAKVLRAWGGQPTGTPGSHVSHGSHSHKHSGQGSSGHQQSQGSSSWAMNEGVATFAGHAFLAIIDVSDVSGSDETLKALCQDLVQ